jgi:signal transduction histidine kinase
VLLVPTFYQQEFNGIIVLHQCDRVRQWNQAELELVQELADQVGTAMAHAMLYQKLEQANIEAKEASRLKSEFLASTSHELRTPLNGILGFLKLILDDMTDSREEEREFLDQAYHSALHLLNLINDILDIAKIEAGKLEFNLNTISLQKIYQDIEKFARTQAQNKNLSFNINLPPTYDQILLYADYQRLLQIMLNLVSNSLKFTHTGGIEITTEIIPKTIKFKEKIFPGMVKISVADTGIGVSLEKQEKLFETFYQVDGSRTKAYGGTGLGLAISKRLVEAMGGKISFYSMGEELGSTVTLTIPLSQIPLLKKSE